MKKPSKAPSKASKTTKKEGDSQSTIPLMAQGSELESRASTSRSRRNVSSTIHRTDRFKNIDDGLVPFKKGGLNGPSKNNTLDVRDAVVLCQKAYYNFAVFRNTIDLMTEFSVNDIYFKGGSKKARDFFRALFKKINLWNFQDKFFREYYRSGNVFVHRFDATLRKSDLRNLNKIFGEKSSVFANDKVSLPIKYIILNPADIKLMGSASFVSGKYKKQISDYELERLRNPQTDEEKELKNSLPPEIRKMLDDKSRRKTSTILMPLDEDKTSAVFYKKQDYEPFAVPMGYPVLEDLNAKSEMKKIDMAIARTMQQAVLLVTMGAKPDDGGVNQKNLEAMQKLFANESVGRVLIADYTTKAEFVIPNIANLLNSQKYEVFEKDIKIGLNNILVGENEKFANETIKVKVFIERLKQARETFLNEFLFPEIKRISKLMGFKSVPMPHFDDIDLRDALQYSRVYTRLIELGILTPEEGLDAIERGRLPDLELIEESQEKYKRQKEKGYYAPMIGGGNSQQEATKEPEEKEELPKQTGRPEGTGKPKESDTKNPVGGGDSLSSFYSLEKVKDNLILAGKLNLEVEKNLRSKYKKRKLSKAQKEVAEQITETIIANEESQLWLEKIDIYLDNPIDHNVSRVKKVQEVSFEHGLDTYLSSILYASQKKDL